MNLTIHRGNKEIGGSCVELQSGDKRIILDIGMPLVDSNGNDFNFKPYQDSSIEDLIMSKILPNVKGLYKHETPTISAVLISHPHQDHYGFLKYIHEDIPVYMSEGTKKLIEISGFFNNQPFNHSNIQILNPFDNYKIGDILVKPYLVDHSGFDSMAFLIEAEGKRLFYSGDFRTHGRKSKVVESIIQNPPADIDYLMLEGTMVGSDRKSNQTETDIENTLKDFIINSNKLKLISFSSQNIDRLVSVYRACIKTGHTLVIDPYTANVLDSLKTDNSRIPQFNWNNIRIYFTQNSYTSKLAKSSMLWKYKEAKITIDEIAENTEKIILKNNFKNTRILAQKGLLDNAELIYSQWSGYFEKEEDFWNKHNVKVTHIHTSGHAFVDDLKRFAEALNPKKIIPIHTFNSGLYSSVFGREVAQLSDGVAITI